MAASIVSGGLTQPAPVYLSSIVMNGAAPTIAAPSLAISCSAAGTGNAVLVEAPNSTGVSAITLRAVTGGIVSRSNTTSVLATSTGTNALQLAAPNSTADTAIVIGAPSGGITMQAANDLNVAAHAIVTTGALVALTATAPEAIGVLVLRFGEAVSPAMQPMGLYMCTGAPTVPCAPGSFCFSSNGNSYIATAANTWTAVSHA